MRLLELARVGVLAPVDLHFALAMGRLADEQRDDVLLAAALASRAVQRGHVCADLTRLGREPLLDDQETAVPVSLPETDAWAATLRTSTLVGDGSRLTPLVLDDRARLYLYRYFDYQRRLGAAISSRVGPAQVDRALLDEGLSRLFGSSEEQRRAALAVLTHRFALVSGGPGTGKTTTIAKILALFQEQALARSDRAMRIALLAPTGKAASRLGESIRAHLEDLACSEAVKTILARERAATLHRGLGFDASKPTRFRHDAAHPLAADAVVVDEASMVDLALMTKLAEAVHPEARLVLVGDKDQLASVEAGAILGDLYHAPRVQQCAVHLDKSYRYRQEGGIGALARAVNRGDADAALGLLQSETTMPYGEVALCSLDEQQPLRGPLGGTVLEGFSAYLATADPLERLERLARFRVLCVHRRGPLGAETMNTAVEHHLAAAGALTPDAAFYDGRPVLITHNDYQLGLYNGDVGVVCRTGAKVRVAFAASETSEVRWIDPGRLPSHETVFAMTVHKSQGSEFDRVALLLPSAVSPIVTRELVYTGLSRARERIDVYGSAHVLREAIGRRIERASGLRELLT
jgi:exodeoxyribonuclease V alpha subunit